MSSAPTVALYALAALAEIAGCFAVWAWMRLGASALWLVPGLASLAAFAWLLTLAPSDAAGRAYAAYGASTSRRRWSGFGQSRGSARMAGMSPGPRYV